MRKILDDVREIDWKEFFIDMAIFVAACLLVDWVFYLLK
jgi:hypothetical protein